MVWAVKVWWLFTFYQVYPMLFGWLLHVSWMVKVCLLDGHSMSLGWSQYVSWMVTVCLTQHMVGPQWAMLGWTSCLSTKWHSYLLLNVRTNINNWTSDHAGVPEYNSFVWLFHQATNLIEQHLKSKSGIKAQEWNHWSRQGFRRWIQWSQGRVSCFKKSGWLVVKI